MHGAPSFCRATCDLRLPTADFFFAAYATSLVHPSARSSLLLRSLTVPLPHTLFSRCEMTWQLHIQSEEH